MGKHLNKQFLHTKITLKHILCHMAIRLRYETSKTLRLHNSKHLLNTFDKLKSTIPELCCQCYLINLPVQFITCFLLPSQISDGKPLYVFTNVTSGQRTELLMEGNVSDGQWHVLHLRRRGSYMTLFLDERPVVNTTNGTITHPTFLVETIFLGSSPLKESKDVPEIIQSIG